MFEEEFQSITLSIATLVEMASVLVLTYAAAEAFAGAARSVFRTVPGERRRIWVRFAIWIVLALEFALAADIMRTAMAPTWDAIGMLAAIAAIRTILNYFLVRDVEAYGASSALPENPPRI